MGRCLKVVDKFRPSYDEHGKLVGKRAAERWRDEYLRQVNSTPTLIQSQIRFADLAETYKRAYLATKKDNTRHDWEHKIELYIMPHFRDKRLCDIAPLEVQKWVNALTGKRGSLSRKSKGAIVTILSSIWERAIIWGHTQTRNPCKGVSLGAEERPVYDLRSLTPHECYRLLTGLDEPLRTRAEVAFFAGIRHGEISALRCESLAPPNHLRILESRSRWGKFQAPKGGRGRRVPCPESILRKLQISAGENSSDLVWPDCSYNSDAYHLRRTAKDSSKAWGINSARPRTSTSAPLSRRWSRKSSGCMKWCTLGGEEKRCSESPSEHSAESKVKLLIPPGHAHSFYYD